MGKYCVMPFVSARITESTQGKIKVAPCCHFRAEQPLLFDNMDQYVKSAFLKNLQTHFLQETALPKECGICQRDESVNQLSVRQLKQRYFGNRHFTHTNILELDIFPSNLCNLTCIMCSPYYSTAIGAEHRRLGLLDVTNNFDNTDAVLQALDDLSNIEYVQISGGEFFFLKRNQEILNKCLSKGVANIKIITNGTVCDDKSIGVLQCFDHVVIRFSVDGTGDHYNLIRYPAQWSQTCENIQKFKQYLPQAHLETVMVMQPLNVYSIFDWCEWANQNGLETHWINISSDLFSWKMLDAEEKNVTVAFLKNNIGNYGIQTKQKLAIFNLATNTLTKESFDADVRTKSVARLAQLISLRKLSWQKLQTLLDPWPRLQKDIEAQLN